jgi:WD40 repeat protein
VQRFATKHEDLIHDVSYDYFGKRLATCSSDRVIRVWDLDDRQEWRCSGEWTAHNGSIWKVHWAAPEYGQILASCSFDRTVCIWEEPEGSFRRFCIIRFLGPQVFFSSGDVLDPSSDLSFSPWPI